MSQAQLVRRGKVLAKGSQTGLLQLAKQMDVHSSHVKPLWQLTATIQRGDKSVRKRVTIHKSYSLSAIIEMMARVKPSPFVILGWSVVD